MHRFFGRQDELAQLRKWLNEGRQLICVVGIGGIGKTRLVRECFAGGSPGGSVWVDLSPARSTAELWSAVASALGESPRRVSDARSAAEVLREREIRCLALDNFEQLLPAATELMALIDAHRQLQLVVTSRETLSLASETVLWLGPLSGEAAAELWRERIALRTGEAPAAEQAEQGRRLLERLGGIPLAIELVAHRAASLGVGALETWSGSGLELASGGPRDLSQATLERVLETSLRRLEPTERALLEVCAAFRGGFDAGAVVQVARPDAVSGEATLAGLQALRNKAWLVAADRQRLTLLEPVREFVSRKTEPARRVELLRRHAEHFATVSLDPGAVARDHANLLDAIDHLLEDDPALAARAVISTGGDALRVLDGRSLMERVDAALKHPHPPDTAAKLWLLRASIDEHLDAFVAADDDYRRAEAAAARGAKATVQSRVKRVWSFSRARRGHLEEAQQLFEQAEALSPALGQATGGVYEVLGLASALRQGSRAEAARALLEQHLGRVEHPTHRALLELELSLADADAQAYSAALERLTRARPALEAPGWTADSARAVLLEGVLKLCLGKLPEAIQQLEEAVACSERIGERRNQAYSLGYLGVARLELGEVEAALPLLQRAQRQIVHDGDRALFASYEAALHAGTGDLERARLKLSQATARPATPFLERAIRLQQVHLLVAEAWSRAARGDTGAASEASGEAAQLLDAVSPDSADAHLAMRLARRALAQAPAAAGEVQSLTVDRKGAWFTRAGTRIDCSRSANVRRALVCLTEERLLRPGYSLGWRELVSRIWPEQAMLESAAKNRLRVTIAALRKAGLHKEIMTDGTGYRLSEQVPVRWVAAEPPRARSACKGLKISPSAPRFQPHPAPSHPH
jgi:tetratricopeptide (TPR) repeat protein